MILGGIFSVLIVIGVIGFIVLATKGTSLFHGQIHITRCYLLSLWFT
jgi:hypothetical protein